MSLRKIHQIAKRYKQSKGEPAPSVTGFTLRAMYMGKFVWIDAHKGGQWRAAVKEPGHPAVLAQVCDTLEQCQDMLDRHLARKTIRSRK